MALNREKERRRIIAGKGSKVSKYEREEAVWRMCLCRDTWDWLGGCKGTSCAGPEKPRGHFGFVASGGQ